jgi:hypothetical protein
MTLAEFNIREIGMIMNIGNARVEAIGAEGRTELIIRSKRSAVRVSITPSGIMCVSDEMDAAKMFVAEADEAAIAGGEQ